MDISDIKRETLVIKNASSKMGFEDLLTVIKKTNNDKVIVQLFDPKSILNETHVMGAYANALLVFENHTNKTKSLSMEMLLFAALTDQIEEAIDRAGAKSSSDFIFFSNKKDILPKIKDSVNFHSDFNPTPSEIKKTALSLGIKDGKNANIAILQKMALSRLSSD